LLFICIIIAGRLSGSISFIVMFRSVITGSGAFIPNTIRPNADFSSQTFYSPDRTQVTLQPEAILNKFKDITGISERRYLNDGMNASDMAIIAAQHAIQDSGTDPETIDQIIVAHNFGNVSERGCQPEAVPSLANRVKNALHIKNLECIAYDLLFGCPGWLQSVIQADAFCKAGIARKCLLIGTETLSRVTDPFDRDSMIFADGAGACIIEYLPSDPVSGPGILSSAAQSHSSIDLNYISMGPSYSPDCDQQTRYMKMNGRKVYEYAMTHVPAAMKTCLDKSGMAIGDLKKVFLHQANEKMDDGILKRFYNLYGFEEAPENIMPMSIHWLGNSSVATVPTLYDLVKKGMIPPHELFPGDVILFASVGAGMNINAVCYRC
jgi:3-oxoacyl-[acyl-carrier-protein] synthase-3